MEISEPEPGTGQEPNPLDDDTEGDDALTLEFVLGGYSGGYSGAYGDEGGHGAGETGDVLHSALLQIADRVPPMGDPLPGVLLRARRIKRRRRTVRAVSAAAVLVVGIAVVPNAYDRITDLRHPDPVVAGAPAAVVELPTAFPATDEVSEAMAPETDAPTTPPNALGWPSRGSVVPSSVTDYGKSYLLDAATKAGADPASTVGVVRQLWAEAVDGGWLFVGEGWTSGADGLSTAQLLVYRVYEKPSSPEPSSDETVVAAEAPSVSPIRFTHPEPGSSADPAETARIAEISVLLPETNQLLVIGAPQVTTVYYAAGGGKYIQQKTSAGVALFTRTKLTVRGRYSDSVQVRDAQNRDLTPPVGWSVPDFVDGTTVVSVYAPVPTSTTGRSAGQTSVPKTFAPKASSPTSSSKPAAGVSTPPTPTTPAATSK